MITFAAVVTAAMVAVAFTAICAAWGPKPNQKAGRVR